MFFFESENSRVTIFSKNLNTFVKNFIILRKIFMKNFKTFKKNLIKIFKKIKKNSLKIIRKILEKKVKNQKTQVGFKYFLSRKVVKNLNSYSHKKKSLRKMKKKIQNFFLDFRANFINLP